MNRVVLTLADGGSCAGHTRKGKNMVIDRVPSGVIRQGFVNTDGLVSSYKDDDTGKNVRLKQDIALVTIDMSSNRNRNQFRHWVNKNGWSINRVQKNGKVEVYELWNEHDSEGTMLKKLLTQTWVISVEASIGGNRVPYRGSGAGDEKPAIKIIHRVSGEYVGEVIYRQRGRIYLERYTTRKEYLDVVSLTSQCRINGLVKGIKVCDDYSKKDAIALA